MLQSKVTLLSYTNSFIETRKRAESGSSVKFNRHYSKTNQINDDCSTPLQMSISELKNVKSSHPLKYADISTDELVKSQNERVSHSDLYSSKLIEKTDYPYDANLK